MNRTYTPAQLRAFAWLPADGLIGWDVGRRTKSLNSLLWWGLVKDIGGKRSRRYRLTPAGIAERARLVEAGEIK